MPQAALYLRSSKDRSDVSIDAQRRDLERLATAKGIAIVREFTDAVESGKNDMRPGFQAMLRELKSAGRQWTHLLMLDTSRLSRRQYMAYVFDHECQRRGVTVLYSKLPEADPITDMVIKGVLRVFDEFHSLMSREKGLAGMAENVRHGWRAGGRAPRGYRLQYVETGAVRDGIPVRKTKLVPNLEADVVSRYLKGRADGRPRGRVASALGISWNGLVDLEWNALTYAGHTVWNMRRPKDRNHTGTAKRRPRSEWLIQYHTHEALISDTEAETILLQLENGMHGTARRGVGTSLLAGLLRTSDGAAWHGDGRSRYRVSTGTGCRTVAAAAVEEAVLAQVAADMGSDDFIAAVVRTARDKTRAKIDSLRPVREQLQVITKRIARMADMAAELRDRGPALRRIEELEDERKLLEGELRHLEQEQADAQALSQITEAEVRAHLRSLATHGDRETIRDCLGHILEGVELDPDSGTCRLLYRISPVVRANLASPWGFEPQLQP